MVLKTLTLILLFVSVNSFSRTVVFDNKGTAIIKTSTKITIPFNVHLVTASLSSSGVYVKDDIGDTVMINHTQTFFPTDSLLFDYVYSMVDLFRGSKEYFGAWKLDSTLTLPKGANTGYVWTCSNGGGLGHWAVGGTGRGGTGPTGPAGGMGSTGATGSNGVTGVVGATGSNGTNGSNGATGAAGTNGTNGVTGVTGSTGATGSNGATGATGSAGSNGTNGTNGVTGAPGSTGATGATGSDGASISIWKYLAKTTTTSGYPSNGRVQWNNATQISATVLDISHLTDDNLDIDIFLALLSVGQNITIQDRNVSNNYQTWVVTGTPTNFNAGTSTSYWQYPVSLVSSGGTGTTNFGSGATVFIAITSSGQTGATGATGANGSNGTNGTNGTTGITGSTGATGTNGSNGSNGTTGATGTTGFTGATGSNGSNGSAGATGSTGITGSTGTNGTDGDDWFQMYRDVGSAIVTGTYGIGIDRLTATTALLTNQNAIYCLVRFKQSYTIQGVKWFQGTQGAYTANNYNGIFIGSLSGGTVTIVDTSANDGNIWKGTANTWQSKAFTTPYTVSAGTYVIGALYCTSSGSPTNPTVYGASATSVSAAQTADFANSVKLVGTKASVTNIIVGGTQAFSGLTGTNQLIMFFPYQ